MGAETQFVARLGNQVVTGLDRRRLTAKPGDTTHVLPDANVVHLFDGAGNRTKLTWGLGPHRERNLPGAPLQHHDRASPA